MNNVWVGKLDRAAVIWHGGEDGPVRVGSEAHKRLFCRMLLDTHDPYKPTSMNWPALTEGERNRLISLPIWDIAVQTEGRAKMRVLSYAEHVTDPLLKEAITLNGFEEGRHKEVLSHMVAAYGIELAAEPPYIKPRDAEWAFMLMGYSECVDSFFAFGLFELAKRSGFFPMSLVAMFEPVMQEECRHILFFTNWVRWHRRNLSLLRRAIFDVRRLSVFLRLILERIETARDVGGGDNFTMTGHESMGIEIDLAGLMKTCLEENERRMSCYDERLLRPTFMPRMVRIARCFVRNRKNASIGERI
ncbi:MAG TPA: ferritin-like domain-containing protein [Alphaproteobacteria bacterium]|nr:ferritin-like domain-containing protein [Alphaproteobacteria bacterium]